MLRGEQYESESRAEQEAAGIIEACLKCDMPLGRLKCCWRASS